MYIYLSFNVILYIYTVQKVNNSFYKQNKNVYIQYINIFCFNIIYIIIFSHYSNHIKSIIYIYIYIYI